MANQYDYIRYYNEERVQLKGLGPRKYRKQSLKYNSLIFLAADQISQSLL
ncbi:IS3 family transposase [Pasteurella oralis]|uniref:IS3 family transposase n=1 Tax=Pasteurella oralis TaxID=1071947 RepID=A0ABW4NUH5_9PAST